MEAFPSGLASMEAGDWLDAERHFSAALHSASKPEQVKEAASYLTAVKLVKAQVSLHCCRIEAFGQVFLNSQSLGWDKCIAGLSDGWGSLSLDCFSWRAYRTHNIAWCTF